MGPPRPAAPTGCRRPPRRPANPAPTSRWAPSAPSFSGLHLPLRWLFDRSVTTSPHLVDQRRQGPPVCNDSPTDRASAQGERGSQRPVDIAAYRDRAGASNASPSVLATTTV